MSQGGLCNTDCGCSFEDFAPCGDGPYSDCVPAVAVQIDAYSAQFCNYCEGDWIMAPADSQGEDRK